MGIGFNFNEIEKNLSDEVVSSKILAYAGIDTDNVPILVEDAIKYFGFRIGVVEKFKREEILLGIAHAEEKFEPLKSNMYVIFKKGIDINKRRYVMAYALSCYVLYSGGKHYTKTIDEQLINVLSDEREYRVARSLLMPIKSLSTFLNSPLISKLNNNEKVERVSKAFLVPVEVAKKRIVEAGL